MKNLMLVLLMAVILTNNLTNLSAFTGDTKQSNTTNVDIKLFTYKPKTLQVEVGTTVVWTNGDAIEHSVTNGTPDKPGDAFDSGFFTKGQSYSFTFEKPGEYPYFCKRHNSMTGAIKVIP
ncbi:MAG TPA: plastocyanin/azurin family copper-binding protein [Thermodesulfobacteriota bacterium]|nr:plastocyanin/azurin family copper-binding protein [Thermodesulfobacteriota bacterium]